MKYPPSSENSRIIRVNSAVEMLSSEFCFEVCWDNAGEEMAKIKDRSNIRRAICRRAHSMVLIGRREKDRYPSRKLRETRRYRFIFTSPIRYDNDHFCEREAIIT